MKNFIFSAALALLTITFVCSASAGDYQGWPIPDTLKLQNQTLILNGAGFRKKYVFKVYVGALYLPARTTKAQNVITPDEAMAVRMHFTYKNVPKKKFLASLEGGFVKATNGAVAPIRERMDKLFSVLPKKFTTNDVLDLVYTPGRGVVITFNGKYLAEVPGLDFKQAMMGIWLGDQPITNKLKKEMLGAIES